MRVILLLLLLVTNIYAAKLIQKTYPIGDTTCSLAPTYVTSQTGQDVAESNGVEGCVNLDLNGDGLDDGSVRNRWCDQNYQKYHVEIFPNIQCNCGGANCVREYPLDVCYLDGNVPTITTCTDFNTNIGSLPTTVLYIDNAIDNSTVNNITHVHVTNVTNVTNVTVENITNQGDDNTVTHVTEHYYDAPDLDQETISIIVISGSLVLIALIGAGVYVWQANKKDEEKKANSINKNLLQRERQKRTFSNNIL
tara:strand:- start:272 stop:1024 length:753 start_codon:yes stop_codon:yes gene_type:complete